MLGECVEQKTDSYIAKMDINWFSLSKWQINTVFQNCKCANPLTQQLYFQHVFRCVLKCTKLPMYTAHAYIRSTVSNSSLGSERLHNLHNLGSHSQEVAGLGSIPESPYDKPVSYSFLHVVQNYAFSTAMTVTSSVWPTQNISKENCFIFAHNHANFGAAVVEKTLTRV